jgi:hypothetical protein
MQTFLDTTHTAYVFYSANKQFSELNFWQTIMDIIKPLSSKTKQPSTVNPGMYDITKEEWVDFIDLQWNEEDLNKWVTGNTHFKFERVYISFPSIRSCYEKKITPDLFIKASVKATEKEKRYEFVFMIVLENEFLAGFDSKEIETILTDLQVFLKTVFKVKKERPWAIKESELQYGDTLHDFFPSVILANGNEFVFREGYTDWEPF